MRHRAFRRVGAVACLAVLSGCSVTHTSGASSSGGGSSSSGANSSGGVNAGLLSASVATAYSNNAVQSGNANNVPGLDQAYQVQHSTCSQDGDQWQCILTIGTPNPWKEKYEVDVRADGCFTANDVGTSAPGGWQTPQAPVDLTGCLSH
jgi:hypothetical protein